MLTDEAERDPDNMYLILKLIHVYLIYIDEFRIEKSEMFAKFLKHQIKVEESS
jgi:hypothetical protein